MKDPLSVFSELTRFGRTLTGAIGQQSVADVTAECLRRVFEPAGCSVALACGEPSRRFSVLASHGDPTLEDDDPFLAEVHAAGRVVRHVTIPGLGAPLVAAGHTLGIVAVLGKDPDGFGEAAEAVLAAIAAQAAIAVQNTRLIELLSGGKVEWEQMVDAIAPAICVLDEQGSVRRANRSFAALADAPVTALAGRPWQQLLPAEWAEHVSRAIEQAGTPGVEIRSGGRLYAAIAQRIAGQPTIALLIEDVTETRRIQEHLIHSERLSAIGQLIAGVAHELNTPIASILGCADLLVEGGGVPDSAKDPVRLIQQEAGRAAGIVRDLLTFARKQVRERVPMDIGPVLRRTLSLLDNKLVSLQTRPALEIEPDLPLVAGDAGQLQQVFLNLVNNAAQAVSSTGRPGNVTVSARSSRDGLVVEVTDDGPGIPADVLDRVFEPFFTTKGVGHGTGLGLSVCHGIVGEHGGRISVESRAGGGATFRVELPGVESTVG